MIHEDVAIFQSFSELIGLNGSATIDIDNFKEFLKSDAAAENNGLDLADELFLPHGAILVPGLQDSFELFKRQGIPALGESGDSVHGHDILRQH